MVKNLSTKNKTLIFVIISLLVFSIILLSTIYINQKNKLQDVEEKYFFEIKNAYEKIIQRHQEFYQFRLKNILNNDNVKELFLKGDRENLYKVSSAHFEMLKKENPYLKIMHFHLPNGESFLRVHKKEIYGDNIAKRRAMAQTMHKFKKSLNGFEAGIYMLAYREFLPIFENNKYVGALELGSRPDQILYEMKHFNNVNGALFIKNNKIIEYTEKSKLQIGEYKLQYNGLNDNSIIQALPKNYDLNSNIEITYKDKTYAVYPFDMHDYAGKVSAKAVFFHDISDMKNAFFNTLKQLILLIFGLLGLLIIVIHLGFSKIIETLNQTNEKLIDNDIFTQSILDNSPHAIITIDKKGTIILFNHTAQQLLGYKEEEVLYKKTPLIFHKEEEIKQRQKEYNEDFNTNIDYGLDVFLLKTNLGLENNDEWTFVDKNKGEFPVSLHITKLINKDGEHTGYLAVAEDITFKKILENSLKEQKDELQAIFDTTKDGIAMTDLNTNFLFFNDAYLKMTGFTKDELLEKSCIELSVKEDIQRAKKALEETLEKGYVENFEKTCIVKDGRKLIINISLALMPDGQRLLISAKDVTEIRKKDKQLKKYVNLIDKQIITSSTDLDGNITEVSEAFCKISGFTKEELLGKNHRIIKHSDMKDEIFEEMWDTILKDKVWKGELKNKTKDEGFYWVDATISPVFNDENEKIGYTAIRQDITDKKIIEEISITDGLTNIFNRRHFNDIFPKIINSARRKDEIVSFLIMDIDHFKQYNDTYGHQMGDEVLIQVAKAIKETLKRADDHCFRLGGEEFGVIFKVEHESDALTFANTIRANIENLKIEHTGNSASSFVTASMGLICEHSSKLTDVPTIYKNGDELLYKAKESGRNRVCSNIS